MANICLVKYILVLSIFSHYLCGQVVNHEYKGTLAFLKSGANISPYDLWTNSTLTNTTGSNRHMLPLRQLLNNATYYRSPLIEQWDDLNVNSVTLLLLNDEQGLLGKYHFEGNSPGYIDAHFFDTKYLQSSSSMEVESNFTFGPSIYIYKASNVAKFSFMSIDMSSGLTSLNGTQFIISADANFNYLTNTGGDAKYNGCYKIPVFGEVIDIEEVFQCTYHCLTVADCRYYGIYTNSTAGETRHRCVPLFAMPVHDNDYCDTMCSDNRPCGAEYDGVQLASVAADIYSMDPPVFSELMSMKHADLSNTTAAYKINEQSAVDMGTSQLIAGINVRGPGTYKLLLYHDDCVTMFDSHIQLDENSYYGVNTGNVKTFITNNDHNFAPVRARCLYFNSTTDLYERSVDVFTVNNKFLLADYLVVNARWENDECSGTEVMSNRDLVPDSMIEISQGPFFLLDVTNGKRVTVPMESYALVEITLPGTIETWVDQLVIWTSVNAIVSIDVHTQRLCTDQVSGNQSTVSRYKEIWLTALAHSNKEVKFEDLKSSSGSTFCVSNFTVFLGADSASDVAIQSTNATFEFSLMLHGCHLDPGLLTADSCYTRNLLNQYDAEINGWLFPKQNIACDALRPGGRGLQLPNTDTDVYVSVYLSDHTSVEVKTVVLTGTFKKATVNVGGDVRPVLATTGSQTELEYTDTESRTVLIYNIKGDGINYSNYITLNVEIYACLDETTELTTTPQTSILPTFNVTQPASLTTSEAISTGPAATSHTLTTTDSQTLSYTSDTTSQTVNASDLQTTTADQTTEELQTTNSQQHPVNVQTTLSQTTNESHSDMTTSETTANSPQGTTQGQQLTTVNTGNPTAEHTTESLDPNNPVGLTTSVTSANSEPPVAGTTTTTTTTTTTQPNPTTTTPLPRICRCQNNITQEELDIIVQELVKNLTVPVETTSAFKRTKMSMPDKRKSSTVIGAVGIACLVTVGGAVVVMDIDHILRAFNFIKSLLKKNV